MLEIITTRAITKVAAKSFLVASGIYMGVYNHDFLLGLKTGVQDIILSKFSVNSVEIKKSEYEEKKDLLRYVVEYRCSLK